jgi:hypothetical protein
VCIDDRITLSFNLFNGDFVDYGEMHLSKKGILDFKFEIQKLPQAFSEVERGKYFKPS